MGVIWVMKLHVVTLQPIIRPKVMVNMLGSLNLLLLTNKIVETDNIGSIFSFLLAFDAAGLGELGKIIFILNQADTLIRGRFGL